MFAVAAVMLLACAREGVARNEGTGVEAGGRAPSPETAVRPEPSETGPAGQCADGGLAVVPGEVDAAMGLRAMGLDLVNCGTTPVTVEGYPELTLLDEDGAPLEVAVLQGAHRITRLERFDRAPVRVTLAPQQRAVSVVVWRNTVDDLTRPVQVGRTLRVVPVPGAPPQEILPGRASLDIGTTGQVAVAPWLPSVPPSS